MDELIKLLRISDNRMNELNEFLTDPNNQVIRRLWDMDSLIQNYLDKHEALNRTAESLLKSGIGVVCAENIHKF
jgi:hypothetical protein